MSRARSDDGSTISRRTFVRTSTAFAALSAAGCTDTAPLTLLPPPSFAPPRSVLTGAMDEIDDEPLVVVGGRLPTDLRGSVVIPTSVPRGAGSPVFLGESMAIRVSFSPIEARITSRLLRTDDLALDRASAETPFAYVDGEEARAAPELGARGLLGTALVRLSDARVVACGQNARPWEIDPVTLEAITPIGLQSSYTPLDPSDGVLLPRFGVSGVWSWDPGSYLFRGVTFGEGTNRAMITWDRVTEPTRLELASAGPCRQLVATEGYVVIVGEDELVVVSRNALLGDAPVAVTSVPMAGVTHLNVDRRISRMHALRKGRVDPCDVIRAGDLEARTGGPTDASLVGAPAAATDRAQVVSLRFDEATGSIDDARVLDDERLWGASVWSSTDLGAWQPSGALLTTVGFDPRFLPARSLAGDSSDRIVPAESMPREPLASHVLRVDLEEMTIADSLALPFGWVVTSASLVPRRGSDADGGYVLATVLGPEWDELWVLSFADLARGPLCRLRHAHLDVGHAGLATWIDESSDPPGTYAVDRAADYAAALDTLSPEAATLVRRTLAI